VLERIGPERLRLGCAGLDAAKQAKLAVLPVNGTGDARVRCQRAIDNYIVRQPSARVAVIPDGPYTLLRTGREHTKDR